MTQRRLPFVLALGLAAASALAASPVGTWKGKLSLNLPKLPANAPAQQKQMMAQAVAMANKAQLLITFKADKTYTATASGLPMMKKGDEKDTGKWSQAGNVVTVTSKKPSDPVQKLTLAPNGKTMILALPNGQGKMVFTKR